MGRITMKDVADLAGVSVTTVSHVINNTRNVATETRKVVEAAMQELGFRPNSLARSLRNGETKTIGLIIPDVSNPFFAEISRKIEDLGYQQGYSVILGNSDNNPAKQSNYVNTLLSKQVDGMIFISTGDNEKDLHKLSEFEVPVVVADREVSLDLADVVIVDNMEAGYLATKHLLDLDHRNIACISGPYELSPSMKRIEGYKRALAEFGLGFQKDLVEIGNFSYSSGEIAMSKLLQRAVLPSAVFVLNDIMAIGAMTAVKNTGLKIPEDISIIGFDNIELASAVTPSLTTIEQPLDELAQIIIELLTKRIIGARNRQYQRVVLSASLIKRDSTSFWRKD